MRRLALPAVVVLATASIASCTSLLGSDYQAVEPAGGAGGASPGGGGTVSTGGGGTGGAPGGAGGQPVGGQGGMGGAAVPLVDDGLVVRYYFDEAATGAEIMLAADAAMPPMDLTLWYQDQEPNYTQGVSGNRGLMWTTAGSDGGPYKDVTGTKLQSMVSDSNVVTMELVADIRSTMFGGQLLHIGEVPSPGAVYTSLSFRTYDSSTLSFAWKNNEIGFWSAQLTTLGRSVFHLVVNTDEVSSNDRVRVYIDGERLDGSLSPMTEGSSATVFPDDFLVVGNRDDGDHSIEGIIYYAAIYAEALTDEQIFNNVAVLQASDDTPASSP